MKVIYTLAFLLLLQFAFAFDTAIEIPQSSPVQDSVFNGNRSGAAYIVFKSADGGQTWQDISEGLPKTSQDDPKGFGFFANESGLHLSAGNEIFHSKPISIAPFWTKEVIPAEHSFIAPGKTGIIAYNNNGQILQKINGSGVWSPMYTNFQEKQVNTVFETAGGVVFIGSNKGLFKSTNSGKTWKQVYTGGWGTKMVESNGVLMATSQNGILRSTDVGETWQGVLYEGGVTIALEPIKGGFATINYNTQSMTRRVRTSYDGGKTWQPIDAGLKTNELTASIIEVGGNFFCGHPDGVFKSADKGKTWKNLLPSRENKMFKLYVSGKVIYAILVSEGC